MIDFIPLPLYTPLFNYFVLFLVVIAASEGFSNTIFKQDVKLINSIFGVVVTAIVILYMGLRPVSDYYFGDTINYATSFYQLQIHGYEYEVVSGGEWVFNSIMRWFAAYSDIHMFFLFCASVYVGAMWWALVRIFRDDYFVPLIVVMSMFTFWSYGVNGIRNGMASSLVILALSFRRNLPVAIGLSILALGIHKSMMITIGAGIVAVFIKNPKLFLWGWLGSILVSLTTGNLVADMVTSIGFVEDDRFSGYLTNRQYDEQFSNTGFRWDFLLYSSIPVLMGSYFIFKRNYTDKFYIWLFNIYLTTNALWILVIRASFSNRFAQLSWFIMPLVLIYPFFMKQFWADQPRKIGWAVILFYLYTFYSDFLSR